MSVYSYCSKSQYPQRAAKRMIGFQIFCYRHKYKLSTEVFCKRCGISPKELEKVELGLPSPWAPRWHSIRKVLESNNLQLHIELRPKEA